MYFPFAKKKKVSFVLPDDHKDGSSSSNNSTTSNYANNSTMSGNSEPEWANSGWGTSNTAWDTSNTGWDTSNTEAGDHQDSGNSRKKDNDPVTSQWDALPSKSMGWQVPLPDMKSTDNNTEEESSKSGADNDISNKPKGPFVHRYTPKGTVPGSSNSKPQDSNSSENKSSQSSSKGKPSKQKNQKSPKQKKKKGGQGGTNESSSSKNENAESSRTPRAQGPSHQPHQSRQNFADIPLRAATREDLEAAIAALNQQESTTFEERLLEAGWEDEEPGPCPDNTHESHITWDPLRRPHQLYGDKVNVFSVDDITHEEFKLIVRFMGEFGREDMYPHVDMFDQMEEDDAYDVTIFRLWRRTKKWATRETIDSILKSKGVTVARVGMNDGNKVYVKPTEVYEIDRLNAIAAKMKELEDAKKVLEDAQKARQEEEEKKAAEEIKSEDKGKSRAEEGPEPEPDEVEQQTPSAPDKKVVNVTLGKLARSIIRGPPQKKRRNTSNLSQSRPK